MKRREFVKKGSMLLAGGACTSKLSLMLIAGKFTAAKADATGSSTQRKYGMVINLNKCLSDCTACLDACRKENNVAFHHDKRWDIHRIRKVKVKRKHSKNAKEKPVLLLCNHCDHPPCAQACPVNATFKRDDGIVLVDHHRCVGCRYCMIACPYNARHFNYKENHDWPNKEQPKRSHGVPESCTFCVHRLDTGKKPACVEASRGAIAFGDLNDPNSIVRRLLSSIFTVRRKASLGTEPSVFYIL